jgi:serine/threonine protein kinase
MGSKASVAETPKAKPAETKPSAGVSAGSTAPSASVVLPKQDDSFGALDELAEDIRDKYKLGKLLGSGTFGQVVEAQLKSHPTITRAVKIMEREVGEAKDNEWSVSAIFRKEVELLQTMRHKNIVRFWDVYEDVSFLYVVMDLCKGGEVFTKLLALRRFTEGNAATIGAQMVGAIDYIHSMSVMHRDIKAENFLLEEDSTTSVVKMIDFGMACKFSPGQKFNDICGSPHYLAPELVGQRYSKEVDMWALGVLLYLLLYGQYPFDGDEHRAIMMKIVTEQIKWSPKVKLQPNTVDFMKACLQQKIRERISAAQAMKHPWIVAAEGPDGFEKDADEGDGKEDLKETVRSAHRKASLSKPLVKKEVEEKRVEKLEKINKDFEKGIRNGTRLGPTPKEDFMSKPECIRRKNRMITAPSRQVTPKGGLASIMADVVAPRNKSRKLSVIAPSPHDFVDEPSDDIDLDSPKSPKKPMSFAALEAASRPKTPDKSPAQLETTDVGRSPLAAVVGNKAASKELSKTTLAAASSKAESVKEKPVPTDNPTSRASDESPLASLVKRKSSQEVSADSDTAATSPLSSLVRRKSTQEASADSDTAAAPTGTDVVGTLQTLRQKTRERVSVDQARVDSKALKLISKPDDAAKEGASAPSSIPPTLPAPPQDSFSKLLEEAAKTQSVESSKAESSRINSKEMSKLHSKATKDLGKATTRTKTENLSQVSGTPSEAKRTHTTELRIESPSKAKKSAAKTSGKDDAGSSKFGTVLPGSK